MEPRTIAVDLTPVLPGGENGGAKIFVLELLARLAALAPRTQFVLLTQAASHAELASLERPNMRRRLVLGSNQPAPVISFLRRQWRRIMRRLPGPLARVAARFVHTVVRTLRRGLTGSLLRELNADLLFCPFTAPTYHELGIPTVCTIYDLQFRTYPEFFTPQDVAHRERTFAVACRDASALVAISDYSRASAIKHGTIDPTRIRTIYLRMARRIAESPADDAPRVLAAHGLAAGKYFIYPANFWRHKNHEMLLTAFGMLRRSPEFGELELVCTGAPGARRDALRAAAQAMGFGSSVRFPGYLPEEELAVLLRHSRGMVFASLYEGFGLPVIEAMAARVPVACSDATSLPEIAAGAAIQFDPRVPTSIRAALASLALDEAARAACIEAGVERALEFADSDRMASEYWDVFRFAIANARRENGLIGTYEDGWAGPRISAQIAPAAGPRRIEFELFAPEWLPAPSISIIQVERSAASPQRRVIQRGQSLTISAAVGAEGGITELEFAPCFVPARGGVSSDHRNLSLMVRRCEVVGDDGGRTALYGIDP